MTSYYVYLLIDPRTQEPFYVGKGKGNRMYDHEKEAKKGKYSRKCAFIRELLDAGLKIIYKVDSWHYAESAAFAREAALIEEIGLSKLTNVMPGGGGVWVRPVVEHVHCIEDERGAAAGLAVALRQCAQGCVVHIGSVNVTEMAKQYVARLIEKFGVGAVTELFRPHNVTVVG